MEECKFLVKKYKESILDLKEFRYLNKLTEQDLEYRLAKEERALEEKKAKEAEIQQIKIMEEKKA